MTAYLQVNPQTTQSQIASPLAKNSSQDCFLNARAYLRFKSCFPCKKNNSIAFAIELFWCGQQDLNLHGVNHKILSLARLPIPP